MKEKREIYKNRHYKHFDPIIEYDEKLGLPEKYRQQIENPDCVAKHSFYPFIKDIKKTFKFRKNGRTREERHKLKERPVMYAAHFDRFIYQYYASILNEQYNKTANMLGISESVIAYRSDLTLRRKKHNSSIEYAKELFDFIGSCSKCLVYVTDFAKYFDNIEHRILKENIERILCVSKLPDDYYKVFKSVTNYSSVDLQDILSYKKKLNSTLTKKELYGKHDIKRFFTPEQFRTFKKLKNNSGEAHLKRNTDEFGKDSEIGIPQGSPISAVLSNIYLIDFDKAFVEFVKTFGGLYRRYCDDIAIVIPINAKCEIKNIFNDIEKKFNDTMNIFKCLSKSKDKTQVYIFNDDFVHKFDFSLSCIERQNSELEYLGFAFNGRFIKIRQKSITKYYKKLYRYIRFVNYYTRKYGKIVYRRRLFRKFSHLGASKKHYYFKRKGIKRKAIKTSKSKYKHQGNFITYANRAHEVFGDKSKIKSQIKKHWAIINKNLVKLF